MNNFCYASKPPCDTPSSNTAEIVRASQLRASKLQTLAIMKLLRFFAVIIWFFLLLLSLPTICCAWEWTDFVSGSAAGIDKNANTLTMTDVSNMRVRDIKRRLSLNHGYSADELGAILDKKELIQLLAFEEHKIRQKQNDEIRRYLIQRGILFAVVIIVITACWPIFQHLWDVASVNFVVYTDRKKHEVQRCRELKSIAGMMGVFVMSIIDILQVWLTVR